MSATAPDNSCFVLNVARRLLIVVSSASKAPTRVDRALTSAFTADTNSVLN